MTASKVRCDVTWYSAAPQRITFTPGVDLSVHLADDGPLGTGLSPVAADLVELGASIFLIERRLKRRSQQPTHFTLTYPARDASAWTDSARGALANALQFLGNAEWTIEVVNRRGNRATPRHETEPGSGSKDVVLFSGGLDSTSGTATIEPDSARLVSYYSRQRRRQADIAQALGQQPPIQWRIARHADPAKRVREPGRSFRYRTFLFLSLAAASASAFESNRLLQFENGVLASAIPPSEAWLMTKHAHPRLQQNVSEFFSELLSEPYVIDNPFRTLTKRQCVGAARKKLGADVFDPLAERTDSCWHMWSNRLPGASKYVLGDKRPGIHCGVCIPCLVRRTALKDTNYAADMRDSITQNHDRYGRDFRAYYGFLERVRRTTSDGEFYRVLPAAGRHLFADPAVSASELFTLFHDFADEFWDTFVT